jgi:hypothetical protein
VDRDGRATQLHWRLADSVLEFRKVIVQEDRSTPEGHVGMHDALAVVSEMFAVTNGTERRFIELDGCDAIINDQVRNRAAGFMAFICI